MGFHWTKQNTEDLWRDDRPSSTSISWHWLRKKKRKKKCWWYSLGSFWLTFGLGLFFFCFFHLLYFLFFPYFSLVHLAGVSLSAHGCLVGNGRSLGREAWSQKVWLWRMEKSWFNLSLPVLLKIALASINTIGLIMEKMQIQYRISLVYWNIFWY